jgi:hypothetical protein
MLRPRTVGRPWFVLALLVLAACGDPHAGVGRPVDAAHCTDLPFLHGDPGLLVGTHWSSDRRDWGQAVTVYACADPGLRGSVHLSASDSRIRITPAEHPLDGAGIYAFEITPSRGASGGLEVWFQGSDGMVDVHLHGPRVGRDGDGWHFEARTP